MRRVVGVSGPLFLTRSITPALAVEGVSDDADMSVQRKYLHELGALRRCENNVYWGTVSFSF